MKIKLLWIGVLMMILPSLLQAYLLMPFPFSQDFEAIEITYFLQKIILSLRIIGLLSAIYPIYHFLKNGSKKLKITVVLMLILSIGSYYFTDIAYNADEMFQEPKTIHFSTKTENKLPDSLIVISVVKNGIAKAYPVNIIGYHHKIQDSVGGVPVLVTYCTMCRTGLTFDPILNGKKQTFRLVGARHYNAILEDEATKSWWYQATGNAAVGKLKGLELKTIPSEQMTLKKFFEQNPNGVILQPDNHYRKEYDELKFYDRKQKNDEDSLTNPNKFWAKSWVIGISTMHFEKAYEWKKLTKIGILNDYFDNCSLLLAIEPDNQSFHVFDRSVDKKNLFFELDLTGKGFRDKTTNSLWNWNGECVDGSNIGKKLTKLTASQEYWRAWKQFHQNTYIWNGAKIYPNEKQVEIGCFCQQKIKN